MRCESETPKRGVAHRLRIARTGVLVAIVAGCLMLAPRDARADLIFDMFDQNTNIQLGTIEINTTGPFFTSNIVAFDFTDPVFGVVFGISDVSAFGNVDGVNQTITINLTATTGIFDILEFNLPTPNQAEWSVFPDAGGFAEGIVLFQPAQVIPEPSSFVLLAIGTVVITGYGWRRRRRLSRE